MTITIAAIAMGIAVDDTLHFVHGYMAGLKEGEGQAEAAAEEARKAAEEALANQSSELDYGRASAQLAEAAAQLATLRKLKNRAGR